MAVDLNTRVRTALTENVALKVLSFVFALVIYAFVHESQDAQRQVEVGVTVRLPPDSTNRVLVDQSENNVRVTLKGSRAALDELHAADLGTLQIEAQTGTEKRVTLDPRMLQLPSGVRVESFDPPSVDLTWEELVVRDVPIQVSLVGVPAPGYVVKGAPVADPSSVRVRGPKSEVLVVQYARADAFDVTGLVEGRYTRHLAVDKPPRRLAYDVSTVLVTTEITRELIERQFTKVPVAVLGQTKGKTTPGEVDVRLTCPPEVIRGLRPEQVVPRVDVKSTAPSGSVALPVDVSVDQCAAVATPSTVVVRW